MYTYTGRVVLVGESAVGKSCVLSRFIDHQFQPVYDLTIGVDYGARVITTTDQIPIRLQVWDTAGQETFRSITRSYYRGASVIILMYDVTRRETLIRLVRWLKDLAGSVHLSCVLVLVGNKVDLQHRRQISTDEGRHFAQQHGLSLFVETSAKQDLQVDYLFQTLADLALRAGVLDQAQPQLVLHEPCPRTGLSHRCPCL